ncbi:uncharacterized protein [Miscanthus floridulus]|uniref:uncharacterized protein isoform X2 n=1 Tax=Miscanthus floridulus TaxID=154761 RepID=UPI0034595A4F
MYSGATKFDKFENDLEIILRYPSSEPVCLPLEFLESITDGVSSDQIIGTGGFGVVYKGMLRSGNVIAVKKISDMHNLDDNRYQRELESLMGIVHKNVVRLVGYCVESKWGRTPISQKHIMAETRTRLLCFEYLGNGSLDKYIASDRMGFGWDRRYNIIEGICKGLYFLHEEWRIVHRDLKPQNIMIDDDMVPKIMDFGLSRLLDEEKSKIITQNLTGSLGYMAPEYIDNGEISPEADIFSLGVIILEIITGNRKYPQTNLRHCQYSSDKNSTENIGASLQQFSDKELGRWRKIFESSRIDATLQEVYSQQLEQLIDIALKCVEPERKKRPHAWDILQIFIPNAGDIGSCDINGNNDHEASELLGVQSPNLEFSLDRPSKIRNTRHQSTYSLHLNNNTYAHVAFRLVTETLAEHFVWPLPGIVPPRCRYTLAVTMRNQQKPRPDGNAFFTLESTMASIEGLHNFPRYGVDNADKFFTKAKERGREVHQINLTPVYVQKPWALEHKLKVNQLPLISSGDHRVKPRIMIIQRQVVPDNIVYTPFIDVHPTEPCFVQEPVPFSGGTRVETRDSSYYYQERIWGARTAKFIAREKWIVVGSDWGFIKVYSCIAMRNFKGLKSCLFSEIKKFQAHEHASDISLDVHPTGPFLLSASSSRRHSSRWTGLGTIKLWDWENGWVCIRTFDTQIDLSQVKFNPMDPNRFVTVSSTGDAKVWNISSPSWESTLSGAKDAEYFDFFTRDNKLHLIISHYSKKKATIWDYDTKTLVETLEGHTDFVTAVCSHSEFSILMTGSDDGTIRLWNKDTFRLEAILDCGLGPVRAIACLKGSRGIVIRHQHGLAITEFDQEEPGASV